MKHCCLPSVWQGVRRFSALLVCMLFTFVFVVSNIKVKAEAFPIPPVWLPMNPYNAQGLEGNYVLLNDDQKEIVKEIIGAVNIVNLGFGQYVLMNPISGVANTRQFLREYGGTFLETFWSQIMGTSRAMTDFVGSTIYKASTYDTLEEYEEDTAPSVASGSQKYFQISPELTVAFKNWYRANGGVEYWQTYVKPFESDLTWNTYSMNESQKAMYDGFLNSISNNVHVRRNGGRTQANQIYCFPFELSLFFSTANGYCYLFDNSGIYQSGYLTIPYVSFSLNTYEAYTQNINLYLSAVNSNNLVGSSYVDKARYAFNNSMLFFNQDKLLLQDLIKHVYVGANWNNKEEIYNIDNLNIGSTPSQYIDNISDTGYVDINTLIGQIADEVINLREVVEDSVLVKDNDSAIPYADSLQVAIDKYINQPESGVVIPSDIFGGLTGANGPVSYLWFMTKPLVSYTGDLLGLLTLEGDGTFQFTGLGYIVIGVVTIGIIGGLVTKCLL